MTFAESLEKLATMPEFLEAALERIGTGALARRPGEGEFAFVEQACHLRDLEREGYQVRVRRMLSEITPELVPFDGDTVARERRYLEQDARAATKDFAAARRELLGLLSAVTPVDLQRKAMFEGNAITLSDLVAMVVAHDQDHREQIERLLARV
jgi:hypothetical protein